MLGKYGNIGKGSLSSPVIYVWLKLALISALILILAGCGSGGSSGNAGSSGPKNTGAGDDTTAQTKTESQSTSEGASKTEEAGNAGQASGGDAELGTPALGDSGAPVVMVEYSDYQ